jgi:hypothetical protein
MSEKRDTKMERLRITPVANGYVIFVGDYGDGLTRTSSEQYVFQDAASMASFIRGFYHV